MSCTVTPPIKDNPGKARDTCKMRTMFWSTLLLQDEDNLLTVDTIAGPQVSLARRFHCTCIVLCATFINCIIWYYCSYALWLIPWKIKYTTFLSSLGILSSLFRKHCGWELATSVSNFHLWVPAKKLWLANELMAIFWQQKWCLLIKLVSTISVDGQHYLSMVQYDLLANELKKGVSSGKRRHLDRRITKLKISTCYLL